MAPCADASTWDVDAVWRYPQYVMAGVPPPVHADGSSSNDEVTFVVHVSHILPQLARAPVHFDWVHLGSAEPVPAVIGVHQLLCLYGPGSVTPALAAFSSAKTSLLDNAVELAGARSLP